MTEQLPQAKSLVARDIMTERVRSFSPANPIPQAISELLKNQFSEMPVVDGVGQYCGMFSETCCMRVVAMLVAPVDEPLRRSATASDAMKPLKELFTLSPGQDVHAAMASLLHRGCSGAPVIDPDGRFLGIFSERTCMGYVVEAAYNQLPAASVREFTDPASNRLVDCDTDLYMIARLFMTVPYRSFPVMRGNEIVGKLSRRDVLLHSGVLTSALKQDVNESQTEFRLHAGEPDANLLVHETLRDRTVSDYTDAVAQSISPETNLFSIARMFLVSSFRHFPVVEDERLVGLVSRCDVLEAVLALPV